MKEVTYNIMKTCFDMIGIEIEDGVLNNIPDVILYQFNAMSYEIYSAIFRELKLRISKSAFIPLETEKQSRLLMEKRFANIGLGVQNDN